MTTTRLDSASVQIREQDMENAGDIFTEPPSEGNWIYRLTDRVPFVISLSRLRLGTNYGALAVHHS